VYFCGNVAEVVLGIITGNIVVVLIAPPVSQWIR